MGGEKECRVGRFIIANRAAQSRSHREGDTLAVELARKQEDACGKQGEGRRRLQGPEVGARSCVEHPQSRRLLLLLEGGPPSRAREGALIYCSPPGSSVHGILQARRLECHGTFEVASRVPSTVSHFKTERGNSLEML